jgi:hypothetical protein
MPDPSRETFKRTRKEAIVAIIIWVLAGFWTVPVSYWLGTRSPASTIAGIPTWVIWGVFVPWLVFFIIHSWYSLFYIQDEAATTDPNVRR